MPLGFMGYQVTEKVMHASERTAGMHKEYACTGNNTGVVVREANWSLLTHIH